MSIDNITGNKNLLMRTCSVLLTVIFFILSFLTGFSVVVTFVLGLLLLALEILLNYKAIKDISFYLVGVLLVPILSYGVICSLSYFSSYLLSITTRVFISLNMLVFVLAGFMSKEVKIFDFKLVFKGIFISLSIICLINFISTMVAFGPFYGFKLALYYSYYDGEIARNSVASSAYCLCGFMIKEVPIEYYLLYPYLLLTSVFFYLLGDRKNLFNIISTSLFVVIVLISIIFVISKISLVFTFIYLLFICLISLIILFKKIYNKAFKYTLICVSILFLLFALMFFLNSQHSLNSIRHIFASNRLINYVFNSNRYSENARVVLNGILSANKLIGFPIYYDYDYMLDCTPSNNILINQFMYGGIFGFLFFTFIVVLFVFTFIKLRKVQIEDKLYKYAPMMFVISYFVITMLVDQNNIDMFDYSLILPNFISPFFAISLFIYGHYYSLVNKEEEHDEK